MKTTPVVATAVVVAAASTLVGPSAAFSSSRPNQQGRPEQVGIDDQKDDHPAGQQPSRRDFLGRVSESAVVAAAVATGVTLPGLVEPANAAIKTGAANSFTG